MELDRDLVRALDGVEPRAWTGRVLRHHAPRYEALDGQGARINGGRWNPGNSFAVVYTAFEHETIDSELRRLSERMGLPVAALLPRRLSTLQASLQRVLDLTDAGVRRRLGLRSTDLRAADWAGTQRIGLAAQYAGYEAILAPGADGGTTLAVFPGSLGVGSSLSVASEEAYVVSPPLP